MKQNEVLRENILFELIDYIISTERIPKVIGLRKGRIEVDTTNYISLFGSYYNVVNVLMESDFVKDNYKGLYNKWITNRDSIINGILAFNMDYGRNPKQPEYIQFARENKYYQKVNWIFDDFNLALKEATGTQNFLMVKFNEDEVINNIQLLARELGKTPGYREYLVFAKEKNLSTNLRQYHPWNYFVEKAELKANFKRFSKKEIIELFLKLMNKLRRVPLKEEFSQEEGYPTAFLIDKYFGGYNKFLSFMGLDQNHRDKYELEELKYFIDEYRKKYGKNPTRYSFNLEEGPNSSVYQKRFGTWGRAIEILTGDKHFKSNQFGYAYKSNHGDIRPSYQEGIVDDIIGAAELDHKHDVYYKELVSCELNYTMDFFIENKYIIEVAGMISEHDFENDGANLKEESKREYLRIIKHKVRLVEGTRYKMIIIFKGEKLEGIFEKLSEVSIVFNAIDMIKQGDILDKNLRTFPV